MQGFVNWLDWQAAGLTDDGLPAMGELTVVHAERTKTYTNHSAYGKGLFELIQDVLWNDGFGKRRGAVVSLKKYFTKSGHSVAVYRSVGQVFFFFDPNFGAYSFNSSDSLTKAFCYLFSEGYTIGKSRDTGKYLSGADVQGDYIIFAWAG